MADAVTTNVVINTPTHYVVHLTGISDSTGESAVVKVDKSTLTASDGAEPAALEIEMARWAIQGYSSIRFLWDHNTDDTALVLCGSGFEDFTCEGIVPGRKESGGLKDPRSTGGAGDILLTTAGHAANATYDITLWILKAAD